MWEKIWSWDRFEGEQHTFINDSSDLSVGMTIDDNIRLPNYSFIAGFDPIQEQALIWSYDSISQINLKQNYQITPLTSYDLSTSNCTNNNALPFCKISSSRFQVTDFHYINFPSKQGWVVGFKKLSKDLFLYKINNYVSKIATLPNSYLSFFYKHSETGESKVFYCSSNGNLHKYNTSTEIDTQLNLLDGNLKCSGQTLYYSQRRNSLMFPFKQNSLSGVAEYDISDE
ncbi:MAG: hypothetical protein HOJ35_03550 [Bdellovibrionales bacterium]|nr:hypothetical protein [Bdellovibrionales bacterium]